MSGRGLCLALDAGNTMLSATLFDRDGTVAATAKMVNDDRASADQIGTLLVGAFAARGFSPEDVAEAAICSVTPRVTPRIAEAVALYFRAEPFALSHDSETGIKSRYDDPRQLGLDRLAAAIAARARHPGRDLVLADLGTAVTVDAISKDGDFLGGAIFPGATAMAKALGAGTARVPFVEPGEPARACGTNTADCVRSGLHHAVRGALRELVAAIARERFPGARPLSIATGGGSGPFADLFDARYDGLVAEGARLAMIMNRRN